MKNYSIRIKRGIVIILVPYLCMCICCIPGKINAQTTTLDCSGNTLYVEMNEFAASPAVNTTQIRTVDATTGTIGNVMGTTALLGTLTIKKTINGQNFYGSSALGVSQATGMFYMATGMGTTFTPVGSKNVGPKDIYAYNPATNALTVILTTPATVDSFHIVKMAIAPTGVGYAIGVNASNTGTNTSGRSLLFSFTTCGTTPTVNCSVFTVLGELKNATYKGWDFYNGDIAFDVYGGLLFVTVANDPSTGLYTTARLFSIPVPASPVSTITMTYLTDLTVLNATSVNGIAFDLSGNVLVATRSTAATPVSSLYKLATISPLVISNLPAFTTSFPANYSSGDLASCMFPLTPLPLNTLSLQGNISFNKVSLTWKCQSDDIVNYFEVERSINNQGNFTAIGKVAGDPNTNLNVYTSFDNLSGISGNDFFYRIKETKENGTISYSNVYYANSAQQGNNIQQPYPNPFVSTVAVNVQLQQNNQITAKLMDCTGQTIRVKNIDGKSGLNNISVDNLGTLAAGIYILQITAGGQSSMQKLIKR
jgi:hypothetical protein